MVLSLWRYLATRPVVGPIISLPPPLVKTTLLLLTPYLLTVLEWTDIVLL